MLVTAAPATRRQASARIVMDLVKQLSVPVGVRTVNWQKTER